MEEITLDALTEIERGLGGFARIKSVVNQRSPAACAALSIGSRSPGDITFYLLKMLPVQFQHDHGDAHRNLYYYMTVP